jgi:hypothetical protein
LHRSLTHLYVLSVVQEVAGASRKRVGTLHATQYLYLCAYVSTDHHGNEVNPLIFWTVATCMPLRSITSELVQFDKGFMERLFWWPYVNVCTFKGGEDEQFIAS